MKYLFKISVSIIFTFNTSCYAQLMQTLNDAQKLKENKGSFIGKPLVTLLKEIKPEIKVAFVETDRADGAWSYIMFKFIDSTQFYKYKKGGKAPLGITVFLKEKFEIGKPDKPIAERLSWKKEDEKKYGNLTIADIRVYGEN